MTDSYNNILISLLGRMPQILTETLYALMIRRKISISEIWVLTTIEDFQNHIEFFYSAISIESIWASNFES